MHLLVTIVALEHAGALVRVVVLEDVQEPAINLVKVTVALFAQVVVYITVEGPVKVLVSEIAFIHHLDY